MGKSGAKVRFLFEIAMLFDRYFVPVKGITGKMSFFFASAGGMAYRKRGLLAGNPRSMCVRLQVDYGFSL